MSYNRQRRHSANGYLAPLDFEQLQKQLHFLSGKVLTHQILEEVALVVWHGDVRVATVETLHERCKNSKLDRYLDQFQEGAKKGVTRLLTAFYFRQAGDIKGEKTFEFTHKSFGEYLIGRRVIRALKRIQTQLERHKGDPDDGWDERGALKHWAEICGPTAMDEYINQFVQNEVAMQPPVNWEKWQRTLCRLIGFSVTRGMPMEQLNLPRYQDMVRQSRNAEEALVAVHSACAHQTKYSVEIRWPTQIAAGEWLKQLQGQREGPRNTLALRSLKYLCLRKCVLHISDLYAAELMGADLARADLFGANLKGANLRGAKLEGAKLEGAEGIAGNDAETSAD